MSDIPASPPAVDPDDDLAAEVDDDGPVLSRLMPEGEAEIDPLDADVYVPREPAFSGVCRGGPYDGRAVAVRFPDGFLLYDKPGRRMWLYAADPLRPDEFHALHSNATDVVDIESVRPAAEGISFDVLAFDPEGPVVT
jgi:hypothetical protein